MKALSYNAFPRDSFGFVNLQNGPPPYSGGIPFISKQQDYILIVLGDFAPFLQFRLSKACLLTCLNFCLGVFPRGWQSTENSSTTCNCPHPQTTSKEMLPLTVSWKLCITLMAFSPLQDDSFLVVLAEKKFFSKNWKRRGGGQRYHLFVVWTPASYFWWRKKQKFYFRLFVYFLLLLLITDWLWIIH